MTSFAVSTVSNPGADRIKILHLVQLSYVRFVLFIIETQHAVSHLLLTELNLVRIRVMENYIDNAYSNILHCIQ